MADFFGNRYFPFGYFPAGYFGAGEELPPGSIVGAAHGSSAVTGNLDSGAITAASISSGEQFGAVALLNLSELTAAPGRQPQARLHLRKRLEQQRPAPQIVAAEAIEAPGAAASHGSRCSIALEGIDGGQLGAVRVCYRVGARHFDAIEQVGAVGAAQRISAPGIPDTSELGAPRASSTIAAAALPQSSSEIRASAIASVFVQGIVSEESCGSVGIVASPPRMRIEREHRLSRLTRSTRLTRLTRGAA